MSTSMSWADLLAEAHVVGEARRTLMAEHNAAMEISRERMGRLVREFAEHGASQAEVAEALGVSGQTVRYYCDRLGITLNRAAPGPRSQLSA